METTVNGPKGCVLGRLLLKSLSQEESRNSECLVTTDVWLHKKSNTHLEKAL